jgi:DNA-binding CsgD family transcriptional regulator
MEISTNPAGLQPDNSIEFFVMNGEPVLLLNGKMYVWDEFPQEILEKLSNELTHDYRALKGLYILGIADPKEQLKQYTFCHFGDFDKVPDIDSSDSVRPEYWDCGRRPCLADGLLCHLPPVVNGSLTPHDASVIRMIAKDLPNKVIADRMGVTLHTMNREVKNIARKINCFTKAGIAAFAGQHNII